MVAPGFRASEDSETLDALFRKEPEEVESERIRIWPVCRPFDWRFQNGRRSG